METSNIRGARDVSVPPVDVAARFLVRAAVTAPSIHNTQPWRFVGRRDEIEIRADASRGLPVTDPAGREMVISCGAALFNLCVGRRHLASPLRYG